MLKIEVIRFEAQDVITASCVCDFKDPTCEKKNHYGCPADPSVGHYCGIRED